MNTPQLTPVEPGHRIRLPEDWVQALGLRGLASLSRTAEGILIRPCLPTTWDDIFTEKLTVGTPAGSNGDTEDDLLF